MSAAGLGLGRLTRSATRILAKQANGFHLLRIDGYSQTKTVLPGHKLSCNGFNVGGHSWRIDYYPNGRDTSANHNAISLYLQLTNRLPQHLQARYRFSLLDHGGNAAYELPAANGTFIPVPEVNHYALQNAGTQPGTGCGHEEFIGKEELERREHLIRNDSIVIRCDVGVAEIGNSWLAQDELNAWEDGEESEEEGYEAPGGYGAPRRRNRRKRRADDKEYVKWCLAQR
ncbi:BTB/POZ and MATH domain-containing protein 1 [Lolium perenne]|jgi:speckle-type POZ protein|uniref:BTB/POZ and MATH domain-containing protein 1 n=1 Tax=Lolium perenne TaxID=4522 RepID=UPI0021EB3009|nr:BTB/POZ and MATH domain-containing protein 1-like [Lolium perenne]